MAYTTNEKIGRVRSQAVYMLQQGKSSREVARYFGYAQSTIVKWSRRAPGRVRKNGSLETKSSRSHHSPKRTARNIEAQIVATRERTKRCAEVVHKHLMSDGVNVSLSTVKRVLAWYGCLKKRSLWKKKRRYPIRPDITTQGDLVQFDTVHFVDKHNKRSYMCTAIDVYSRYGYAMISSKANCWQSARFFKQACLFFPFPISRIQTDNGPEFGKHFTDVIQRFGISHRHIHPPITQ